MPSVEITGSPLIPRGAYSSVYYRQIGSGFPLVFLHGGWGYEIYPFDRQIDAFASRFQILIPDRTGFGKSTRVDSLSSDFHLHAATDARLFLDALGIDRCVLWGHSDGAVIAANMGINTPSRYAGIIFEGFHYDRRKISSHEFFAGALADPERLSERVRTLLARDHGEHDWQEILRIGGRAWLEIARGADQPERDLFGGRLGDLNVPAIFIHGSMDPRTEPDELDRVRELLPNVSISLVPGGEHAPHAEPDVADEVNRIANGFLERVLARESV